MKHKSGHDLIVERGTIKLARGTSQSDSPVGQVDLSSSTQRQLERAEQPNKRESLSSKKIWIDLDNSPHVPFFIPIMEELKRRGYEVVLSARNSYQVCELLELHGLKCSVVGGHWGKNRLLKILGTCLRSLKLIPFVLKNRPTLAVSHGSRAQMLLGVVTNTPTIVMYDYEFAYTMNFLRSIWAFTPEYLAASEDLANQSRSLKYPGLKEDVYVPGLRRDPTLRAKLGIAEDDMAVTVRPPAVEAHYHNHESEMLFEAALNLFMKDSDTKVILLPRNEKQATSLRNSWGEWIQKKRIIIPEHAIDGLNLIWVSDFVVSGGGTMNREAAALGVPVYSIFRGRIGAVDRYLAANGRLVLLESTEDVRTKIKIEKRKRVDTAPASGENRTLSVIVEGIISILENKSLPKAAQPANV
jgi:predicted glycosyltransferase